MNQKTLPKMRLSTFVALSLSLFLLGCENSNQKPNQTIESVVPKALPDAKQSDIDNIANNLDVKYRVISNVPTQYCDANVSDGACFEVELSFTAKEPIDTKGWSIYFSQISPVQSSISDEFSVTHINGDLHKITLLNNFSGFKANETKKVTFRANFWMLSETDALPNYLVTSLGLQARVITSTKPITDQETKLEVLPFIVPFTDEITQFKRSSGDSTRWLTSQSLYKRNAQGVADLAEELPTISQAIIPTPKSVRFDENNTLVNVAEGINVDYLNVVPKAVDAALKHLSMLGLKQNNQGYPVTLKVEPDNTKAIGSYKLSVNSKEISIIGVDENGVFNGLQSLASLYTIGHKTLPVVEVDDEPHYAFRGMLVDVARNFHSKEFILTLLDQMAAYKLNKLHLHLGDDEGWRLEIPSLPELTELSSKRCFDTQEQTCLISQLGAGVDSESSINGFYSVSDYQEILKAATARHIQVIPSLDMPGHSRAAMKAMAARYNKYQALEETEKATQFLLDDFEDKTEYSSVQFYNDNTLNVCLESTYDFILEVMTQVKQIHSEAGQPLTRYHIGADETAGAWLESPACKAFVAKNDQGVSKMSDLGAYFIERVAGILLSLDIEVAGWSDGMEHTRKENMPAIVQANSWDVLFWEGHKKVHALANRDWQVVLSSPDVLYFDFPYEADPKEHGYYWASRHTNTEKVFQFMPDNLPAHAEFWLDREDNSYVADDTKSKLAKGQTFLGIQGQLWSENTRSDEVAEHKIYPRLIALAERAWHLPSWAIPYNYDGAIYSQTTGLFTTDMKKSRDDDWRLFAQVLGQKELPKLELAGVDYRLPTVGAVIEDGVLKANIAFPGLIIEYQINNTESGPSIWHTYTAPVKVTGAVSVRSRAINGLRTGRITKVTK
ncbi:family 20 glycosylhydrolase [Colwellia sp. 6_MG-2023]|uniref:family 20 glycosylhydrolase n=1 Tax=Colwellia sp. 6_MG-2023 TaxID=3062676 RepID=UPI0026E3FF6B|nr:family 20 glycosylhydrolase [Colwellia sp. 6_MG-2023]MDO6488949.1 family 20 glycosylhydrolase [Colwellia sp. 6_MG-2023]